VSVFHEKMGRVFLWGDGVVLGDLEYVNFLKAELESPRSSLILAHTAAYCQRRFLCQVVEFFEQGMGFVGAENRCLKDARSVADKDKTNLAARAFVINPTADLNILARKGANIFNINPFHSP